MLLLETLRKEFQANLFESVLPFWLQHGLDRVHGGYFACLDRQGQRFDPRKYVWMQGRAVWMFARLARTVPNPDPRWQEAAELIFRFVEQYARRGEPRAWFSLSAAGEPVFFQRKPYSAAFVCLAYIEYGRLTGRAELLDEAAELFRQIQRWTADGSLLGRPVLAGQQSYSQLADIMIQAMLAMELLEATGEAQYREPLAQALQQVKQHWLPEQRFLVENAAPQNPHFAEYPEGRLVCAGSSMEVAWFLLHGLRHMPDAELERQLLASILGAMEFGWDREFGGIYYFQDLQGRPTPALESNMKLWWPHTEALYALTLGYSKTGDAAYLQWLEKVQAYTWKTFVDREHGEWFGYCDRQGNVAIDSKGGAYKCIFHVPRCLWNCLQVLEQLTGKEA